MPRFCLPRIPSFVRGVFLSIGLVSIPFFAQAVNIPAAPSNIKEHVILLHGMARSKSSMGKLEKYLTMEGYTVLNDGYPSTQKTVEAIADDHLAPMVERCKKNGAQKIHLVTHSLGGIVVRQYLQTRSLPEGSRIVMISPPNQGSELADALKDLWLYKWRNGPPGQVLGTDSASLPRALKPVDEKIGVITGNRSLNPLFSWIIPGPDDGKVGVERAKLPEMADFLVVPSSHSFIMNHPLVIEQTIFFLQNGIFHHEAP